MNRNKVSITQIADRLGLSVSTVSRALNNHSSISKAVTEKVKAAAEEMGYTPNLMAVNLKNGNKNTIGVIVPGINRSFFSAVIEAIEEQAYNRNMGVLIANSNNSAHREEQIVHSIAGKVDGVIASLAADQTHFAYYNRLHKIGIPLVLFDRVSSNIIASKVVLDDFKGGWESTQHFLSNGCRKIFHFAGPQFMSIWNDRTKGYHAAMQQAGIEVQPHWIFEGLPTAENGRRFVASILQKGDIPDALFFSGDYAALSACVELQKAGFSIPKDIEVSGFANEPFCEIASPPLSSVDQGSRQMGVLAFSMLMDSLEGNTPADIIIQPRLIVRQSSMKSF